MPAFNGTGPLGMGRVTGRGFGPCGLGLGWRGWPQTNVDQKKTLADYKKALEEELEDVKKELDDSVSFLLIFSKRRKENENSLKLFR